MSSTWMTQHKKNICPCMPRSRSKNLGKIWNTMTFGVDYWQKNQLETEKEGSLEGREHKHDTIV